MSTDILIVDDEADIRNLIQGILEDEGYAIRQAGSSEEAYKQVESKLPSLVILDIWLHGSDHDGLEILKKLKAEHPHLPVVMISGHGTIETAVSAIRDGAYDFIEKPFKADRLLLMIQRALENAQLRKENAVLKKRTFGEASALIGSSPAIQEIQQTVERAAPTNSRILIKGDAGTGKDIIARLIHKYSSRADEAYMTLNCASLRPERLEIELFGCVEGVDGEPEQTGVLEQANGGTLLLDGVSDMPLETQGKIVRVLQEQKFQKLGGQTQIEVDVRVIATTQHDLEEVIEEGGFRQDLYYRLNVVPIEVPALSSRKSDIAELAQCFLKHQLSEASFEDKEFSTKALSALKSYPWPGNVRQLKNVIEWIVIIHGGAGEPVIDIQHLPPEILQKDGSGGITKCSTDGAGLDDYMELSLRDAREAFEREYLLSQVERFDGNVSKTAQFIGMERSALHRKLKSLDISTQDKNSDNQSDEQNKKRA